MTSEDLAKYLAVGYEGRGYEFKGARPRTDHVIFARVTRAALGLSNLADGGVVIIGVNEGANHGIEPVGLTDDDIASWSYDDVAAGFAAAADPPIRFELEVVPHDGRRFVVLTVQEFAAVPLICKREFGHQGDVILRRAALYVRGHGKPETSEVASEAAMREVLDLAIDKGVGAFMARLYRTGVIAPAAPAVAAADGDQFADELADPNA